MWLRKYPVYLSNICLGTYEDKKKDNHATASNITISDWFELFLVSNGIIVISKVNHTWIIFPRS